MPQSSAWLYLPPDELQTAEAGPDPDQERLPVFLVSRELVQDGPPVPGLHQLHHRLLPPGLTDPVHPPHTRSRPADCRLRQLQF